MPAKKKTTSSKTADTKRATKSAKKKAESSTTSPKEAEKQTVTNPSAETPLPEGTRQSKPTATELLKRTRHHTPSIFKIASRKHAPIVFSLEDVREILKKRKAEDAEETRSNTTAEREKPAPQRSTPPTASIAAQTPAQKSKHSAASLADILGFGGAAAAPSKNAVPSSEKEVPKAFRPYYRLLLELRSHVRESLGMHAEDTLKRSQKEDSGDISTSADAGTDNFDRDFALSVVSSEQEALREIEAAIKRVHNGTYGVCEITGEKISPERLEAVPFTRFSLEGQRQYESTARRRVSRGGGAFLNEGGADISFGGDDDGDN